MLSLMCSLKKKFFLKEQKDRCVLVAEKYYCNCYVKRELRKCNIHEISDKYDTY